MCEDSFRKLKASFQKTVRYTNAAYRSQRDIYMNAALKHYQGHHPDMKCKEIDCARGHDAWTIFTDTMQCRRDESVMSVPDNVIETETWQTCLRKHTLPCFLRSAKRLR
jgi:hypothetical protein